MHVLSDVYYGNTVQEYILAFGTFVLVLGAFFFIRNLVVARLRWLAEKTETKFDDLLVDLLEMIRNPECWLLAFYAATRPLVLPAWLDRGFHGIVILTITFRIATMLARTAAFLIDEALLAGRPRDASFLATSKSLGYVLNFLIWAGAVLFALSNLGFNVSSMIAGLGIGGVAVALAAQAVLGDLFAAIAIYLDRPFIIGDAITFGDTTGTVDQIGWKTTRLRALGGELLVVPNAQLAGAKIQNWRYLRERRVVLTFGVGYGTDRAKLEALPGQIKALLTKAGGDQVRLDRVHLKGLGASSIDYELVYYVLSADYARHMDIQQNLLLALLRHLDAQGIEVPFPTTTVHLAK